MTLNKQHTTAQGGAGLRASSDNTVVGYTLWVDRELAWAAGTYEYRALGVAVISNTDLFRGADFRAGRRAPPHSSPTYAGHFASLGQVNAFLLERRKFRKRERRQRAPTYFS